MLQVLKKLFLETEEVPAGRSVAEKQGAAISLLVEAALMDGTFDEEERSAIEVICKAQFNLSSDDAAALIAEAEADVAENPNLLRYTQAVKEHFSPEERIDIIEMLWRVVYADGNLHDYEANLLRRIGGLIYVSDRDRGEARKRVLAEMGISS